MAGGTFFHYKHLTSSGVVAGGSTVSGAQALLHTVTLNNIAATAVVTIYDYNSTSNPANVIAIITGPTAGISGATLIFDCQVTIGITVVIATAAADVTVTYR